MMSSGDQDGRDPHAAPVRDAAILVLLRAGPGDGAEAAAQPQVLMGQRGAGAIFMPRKLVFPGGRVDASDAETAARRGVDAALHGPTRAALEKAPSADAFSPGALAVAALRECAEETGLSLGDGPSAYGALRLCFRAVTPPGAPRRFDARIFLAPAEAILGDPEDFSKADGELSQLAWRDLSAAAQLDVPFITSLVLAEIADQCRRRGRAALCEGGLDKPAPFFNHAASSTGVISTAEGL